MHRAGRSGLEPKESEMVDARDNERIGTLDEQLLNAYIDDELEPEQALEIERQLARDPVAGHYVKNARRLENLARAALHQVDDQRLSEGLSASLEAVRRQDSSRAAHSFAGRPYLAIAASLVVLAIGYGAGFLTAERSLTQQMLAMEQARSKSLAEVQVALNHALEYSPSGEPVSWRSDSGHALAELLPIRTLRTQDQRFCREFREVVVIGGVREERHGLSCRVGKEDWRTRLILAGDQSELL